MSTNETPQAKLEEDFEQETKHLPLPKINVKSYKDGFGFQHFITVDSDSLPRVMQSCANGQVRKKLKEIGKKTMTKALQHNIVRAPVGKTTKGLKKSDILKTYWVLYVVYKDETKKELKRLGITGRGEARFGEEERLLVEVVTSSWWITPELDAELVKDLADFVDDAITDTKVPEELRIFFRLYRDRGGTELGLMKIFYYQILEISYQYFF